MRGSAATRHEADDLVDQAFESLIGSYLLTERQRQIGRKMVLGPVICVHYDYGRPGQAGQVQFGPDGPGAGRHYQADVFFVGHVSPKEAVAHIRAYGPAAEHQIFVLGYKSGLVSSYLSLDCAAFTPVHTLMARALAEVPAGPPGAEIGRATTAAECQWLNTIPGMDPVPTEDLVDPHVRYYYGVVDDQAVAAVRRADLTPFISWVSHLYTAPDFRRRGLATALMRQLLRDSAAIGRRWSMLLATPQAVGLYRRLGYRDLAPVLSFTMNRSPEPAEVARESG